MDDSQKSLKYLVEVESLAEDILADRRSIVFLDKRRNENREALRSVKGSREGKVWVCIGGTLVKLERETAIRLITTDQTALDIEINKIRSQLKLKVNQLRDLEYKPPVPGLMLTPLTSQENSTFSGKLY
ncbi:pdrg1 prefoldin-like subunit [Arctopsyche grandis]|uniref:pdrg1 prefoldin-like subunit n=1 Tax=Arctopsyche grandis TaxID=121162 RepID=UPI00406D99A2